MPQHRNGMERQVVEWSYTSGKSYRDPFHAVQLDVLFSHADGGAWRVPAYWAGGQEWRVRFAPPQAGAYEFRTVCSDKANPELHDRPGTLEAVAYDGQNPLLRHGPLGVAASRRTLAYADGTPFFWLGDTWWMGLCKRLAWPDDFQRLAADRVSKGFSVIQMVAGLYPDMPAFDERGMNEAGFPWERDYARINPAYFDMADLRIQWLVRSGLAPCIVGGWAYHLGFLGAARMKQHWRYLIARWAAYPVVWCLAGEAAMPYYLSKDKERDKQRQVAGWTELGRFVRAQDPYGRLVTIHPCSSGREEVADDAVLDFDMLQTGHSGQGCLPNTISKVSASYRRKPVKPVVLGEVNYEGILHDTQAEVQRLTFWAALLSGLGGYTYGANGLWQLNTRDQPYGPSPHGADWGTTPWEDAYRLPGSAQLGLAKQLLERYPWWRFEPHPEWVKPSGSPEQPTAPFAAGIPGEVRLLYIYWPVWPGPGEKPQVRGLEPGVAYEACYWNPLNGREHPVGRVQPDAAGRWPIPPSPVLHDWVLVLKRLAKGGSAAAAPRQRKARRRG